MRIVLTNAVALNGGDAAIVVAALKLFERAFPGASVSIADSQAQISARLHPAFHFVSMLAALLPPGRRGQLAMARLLGVARAYRHLGRRVASRLCSAAELVTLDAYAAADLIVSTGGNYLAEQHPLGPRRFELQICRQLGRPLVFLTQSLGPFIDPVNRAFFRRVFDETELALLRDRRSEQNLRDIGVTSERLHVLPDVVFALGDPELLREAGARPLFRRAPPQIAVSVRSWGHFKGGASEQGMATYRAGIAALIEHLVTQYQARITFLSTCQGVAESTDDDTRIAREIHAMLSPATRENAIVNDAFHAPDQLQARLRGFDVVIGTRMHMLILSLISGVPVLPIAYEFKTRELFAEFGWGDLVVSIEDATPERLVATAERLFERLRVGDTRRELFAHVERAREDAWGAAERLAEVR